jgi:hypothetical protein
MLDTQQFIRFGRSWNQRGWISMAAKSYRNLRFGALGGFFVEYWQGWGAAARALPSVFCGQGFLARQGSCR